MSKIIQSGSGIPFENVRFSELDSMGKGESFFFVPAAPAQSEKGKTGAATQSQASKKEPVKESPPDPEVIRKEAYTRGKKEGRLESEKELHTAVQALAAALEQISRLRESLLSRSREDMVRLVMGVARRVIRTEVEEKEAVIVKTVTGALEAAVESDEYYIRINPADLKVVTENEPLFLAAMKGLSDIHFIADEKITRGGCLAESKAGDVDATIETQLDEIYEHLRKEIG